jgi:hypothetical protein
MGRRDQVGKKIGDTLGEKIEQTNINSTELNKKNLGIPLLELMVLKED